ncbi:MAG: tRNA lysidine(34) synthetase TilS [Burkholderiales bacterium]|nr:tRNA lysidine(34) synthetase TilS [Burkholderiales bacterium]
MVDRVAAQIESIVRPADRLVVGLSGGVDSVVLLDCLCRIARRLRFRLSALHVNHRLSPNAVRWSAFCRRLCRAREVPFRTVRVEVRRGDSVEAAARDARHAVFARLDCDYVVLAHHRDDQVETLLLQLLRGAGVKGLAAMPLLRRGERRGRREEKSSDRSPRASRPGPHILRPLLDVTREAILDYAKQRELRWVEDESNDDVYYPRNFLRHEILPRMATRFPSYRDTLTRAAGNLAEASHLLDELAAHDGAGHIEDGVLKIAALRELSRPRAKNLLRHFLHVRGIVMPNARRLEEALRQALTAKADAEVCVPLGNGELRRHAGALHVVHDVATPAAGFSRAWRGERELALPELNGVLLMRKRRGTGISLARLTAAAVTVRVRRGGERLRPDRLRSSRSLKNLLQEAGVVPWQRGGLPLLYSGERLVWVPEIGIDCAFQAGAGEPSVLPEWRMQQIPPGFVVQTQRCQQ